MIGTDHMVLVLDDDPALVGSVERLLNGQGFQVRAHTESDDFFQAGIPTIPACLLLDNHLGDGITGVQVHEEILRRGWFIPTVFLTGSWDVQTVVKVMRAGADGFLTKPFDPKELVAEVARALRRSVDGMRERSKTEAIRARAATLTRRERMVVALVIEGLLNKEIASQLGIAVVTVKVHRARAMEKLGAGNPAELTHLAALAGITREP